MKSLSVTSRLVSVAVLCFGRVGLGDPEARFFSLLGHSLFGRAGTVGPEVLNFLCGALLSVESVLVTLRHDFLSLLGHSH